MSDLSAYVGTSLAILTPANDNHRPAGSHEWPAYDRLKAGRLMRTLSENSAALVALCRLRHDLVATEGTGDEWVTSSDSAIILEDISGRPYINSDGDEEEGQTGFGANLDRERVTAEHLIALGLTGQLEYRRAPDGQVLPFKRNGERAYQIEDRLRGELGPAKPGHPAEVEAELNGRYDGAAWPKAPSAAKSARHLFSGAQMSTKPAPRTWHSPEVAIAKSIYARKTLAFIKGGMPSGLWAALEMSATGFTSEAIGTWRGHNGKYASAVGTEVQRVALEALIEIYDDYDGCHAESA